MQLAIVSILIILIAILLIVVSIGVYVYKDASRRGMNAALWTFIAVFAPSFIGFIIYLLIRGSYSNLSCPQCSEKVREDFVVCPQCHTKLKSNCPSCNYPYEQGWTVCPKCTAPLPEETLDVTPPVGKTDKTLRKILIAVIGIPVLLLCAIIIFSVIGFSTFSSNTSAAGATFLPVEEYVAEHNNPEITKWVESCDTTKLAVYAFRHTAQMGGQKATSFAVYFPFDLFDAIETTTESGFFIKYARIEFGGDAQRFLDEKYNFLLFSSSTDAYLTLKAIYNGQSVPCEVKEVDFNPIAESIVSTVHRSKGGM